MFGIRTVAMSAATSWGVVALVVVALLAFCWLIQIVLDWLESKPRKYEDPLAEVRRRDEAREIMRRWYEEGLPEEDPEMIRMLDRALETPGKVVTFTRDDDGILHEDDAGKG